jgi:predicted AlkP superfamily phosphohydrolase/phosphomutase
MRWKALGSLQIFYFAETNAGSSINYCLPRSFLSCQCQVFSGIFAIVGSQSRRSVKSLKLHWPMHGRGFDHANEKQARRMKPPRLVVIGLDSAAPELLFDRLADHLPNITRLRRAGQWGRLRSCDPPITVPAWMVATTGLDPGQLGCYGFRNRADRSYRLMSTATSLSSSALRVWDHLGAAGIESLLIGIPQTYPPKPVKGSLVTDFLTPSTESPYTWPPELKAEIANMPAVAPYEFDILNFRTDDKDRLKNDLWRMTRKRFTLARHLAVSRHWQFMMMVEIGLDRAQHAFWEPWPEGLTNVNEVRQLKPDLGVLIDYHKLLDDEIGQLLQAIPDDCRVMIVSDHGACAMAGGFALNQWLIDHGDLVLKTPLKQPTKLEQADIDWPRTKAWGAGGFYGRIFANVKGRELQGLIRPEELESYLRGVIADLEELKTPDGLPMNNTVHRPCDLYQAVEGAAPPDLIAYFGELRWRSVGLVGLDSVFTRENDTGPDQANHDFDGCFIDSGLGVEQMESPIQQLKLINLTPMILSHFGLKGL